MIPRAIFSSFSLFVALLLATVPGCSGSGGSASGSTPEIQTYTNPSSSVPTATVDAGMIVGDAGATAAAHEGNPLCNASHFGGACYPDDPPTAKSCGLTDGDAEAEAPVSLGCRVTPAPATAQSAGGPLDAVQPACFPAGIGTDGTDCTDGSDCLPGYDCVGGGTCRRYCCEGDSICPSTYFCDVQPLVQAQSVPVPVCMPIQHCTLLDGNSGGADCPADDTCAVVRPENGMTGCVEVGTARAGQSCESEHCARGLTCVGAWGDQVCYTLCHTASAAECSTGQACDGGFPMFPDPAFGICE
jgi:hypothetical protein